MNENNTEDYIPYGDEWRKEVMKFPKKAIVELYRDAIIEKKTIVAFYNAIDMSTKDLAALLDRHE